MKPQRPAIGIDSFAYHRWFGEVGPWEAPLNETWTMVDFLDRAQSLGSKAVSVQTAHLPSVSRDVLHDLHEAASHRGLDLTLAWGHRSGLEGGSNPVKLADALSCIQAAADIEISVVRIVCGDQITWFEPFEERVERLAPMIDTICRFADRYEMAIAIENHADMTTAQLVELVDRVGLANLGICFDFGNAVRVGEDLLEAAALAAPYTRMVHVKDMLIQVASVGDPSAWWPTVPLGTGDLPVAEAIALTVKSPQLQGWFVEMANMHPSYSDEDAAVEESLSLLRQQVEAT